MIFALPSFGNFFSWSSITVRLKACSISNFFRLYRLRMSFSLVKWFAKDLTSVSKRKDRRWWWCWSSKSNLGKVLRELFERIHRRFDRQLNVNKYVNKTTTTQWHSPCVANDFAFCASASSIALSIVSVTKEKSNIEFISNMHHLFIPSRVLYWASRWISSCCKFLLHNGHRCAALMDSNRKSINEIGMEDVHLPLIQFSQKRWKHVVTHTSFIIFKHIGQLNCSNRGSG